MDLSNYQSKLDLTKGTYDFCIIKATEGIGFTDKSFSKFAVQLTKLGKLIGCYHYARPDLHGTVQSMREEASFFCGTIKGAGLYSRTIAVLDWETEPLDRPDLIEAWTTRVEAELHTIPFIYGSKSKLGKWKNYEVVKKHPIWMAAWPNTKRYEVGKDPGLSLPTSPIPYQIWQYSSTGSYPGFSGNVDLDYCSLTATDWKQWTGEERKVDVDKDLSEDMRWAIDIGLFKGYGDGTYGPQDPLTREQAAALFRRYTEIFLNK
ncbi:MAG: S-layer homology domain-containing protein [Prevotella sp.]|nr:S-layer homology domain-containing protein [Prevotella sp.]